MFKILITILFLPLLFITILGTAPTADAPHGLTIEFVEGTTLEETTELLEQYDLNLRDYYNAKGRSFLYVPGKDSIEAYTVVYYWGEAIRDGESGETGCWDDNSCPPILVVSGAYDPVTADVFTRLQQDPIVAQADNQESSVFFC